MNAWSSGALERAGLRTKLRAMVSQVGRAAVDAQILSDVHVGKGRVQCKDFSLRLSRG